MKNRIAVFAGAVLAGLVVWAPTQEVWALTQERSSPPVPAAVEQAPPETAAPPDAALVAEQVDSAPPAGVIPNAVGVFVDRFVGRWFNENPDTDGITRVVIENRLGNLFVRMWGKCHPTDCNWGAESTTTADSDDGVLSITWAQGFAVQTQQVAILPDGRLQVSGKTHFTDNSGRPDYGSTHFFVRRPTCTCSSGRARE